MDRKLNFVDVIVVLNDLFIFKGLPNTSNLQWYRVDRSGGEKPDCSCRIVVCLAFIEPGSLWGVYSFTKMKIIFCKFHKRFVDRGGYKGGRSHRQRASNRCGPLILGRAFAC